MAIQHYSSALNMQNLTDRCNQDENNLNAKLQSLEAVQDDNGVKVTEGTYLEQDDFEGLGNLEIKKRTADSSFDGDAFILTVRTDISVFRS